MDWFLKDAGAAPTADLFRRLRSERIIWDTSVDEETGALRRDVARIAADMDAPDRPPPMFWSGIPWPPPGTEPSCDYQFIISIGGTKTDFALMRLAEGTVIGLDLLTGKEVRDPGEIDQAKTATQMGTPKYGPRTPTGQDMVAQMVAHLAPHVRARRDAFERCEAIFLSWGFPHRVIRTGPRLAGGLSARVTKMTKDQAEFTSSLLGQEIGTMLERELRKQIGWSRPVAVANDTVMALHYFLDPKHRSGHARVGLFINGTGTNFSAAEPYAIRRDGYISREGEDYVPDRITRARTLRPGEKEESFFVNYEAGSLALVGTKTRFDVDPDYPLERNALAGGNAFSQQLRAYVGELVSPEAYARLVENWRSYTRDPSAVPEGRAVTLLAEESPSSALLAGLEPRAEMEAKLGLIARAIVARSAIHAALVLAAITERTGFGLGSDGLPDLLGMEGSVWKSPGYPQLVREHWQTFLGGRRLSVDFEAEPAYNASLSGPLYMAAIHRG